MQIDGEDIEILFGNVMLWGIFTKKFRDKKKTHLSITLHLRMG
jgi:hypothetical protein